MKQNWTLLLLSIFCLAGAGQASAQFLVPTLDPTVPTLTAAATGWRTHHVMAASYSDRTGQRKISGVQDFEYAGAVSRAVLGLKFDTTAMDFSGVSESLHTVPAAPYSQPVTLKREVSRVSLAMLGSDFVSLGLTSVAEKQTDWASIDYPVVSSKVEKTGGSLSIKMGSSFYAGGGFSRVKESSYLSVDNNWVETNFGAALKTGTPGGTQFHMEFGYFGSPSSQKEAVAGQGAAVHGQTAVQIGTIELDMGGLVFTANGKTEVVNAKIVDLLSGLSADSITTTQSSGGVLWVPQEGMVLGFSFGNKMVTQIYDDSFSDFEVKLGYIF